MTYWILVGTELGSEIALVPEVEGGGKAIVCLLEGDDLESSDVIYAVKFARGTGSERGAPDPDLAHFLDDMSKSVLDSKRHQFN